MQLKTPFPGFRPHVNLLTNDWLVTLAAGENQPRGLMSAAGYLWVNLHTSPGKIVRIDPVTQTWDTITLAADNLHRQPGNLLYIASKGKIYTRVRSDSTNLVIVVEIDPDTLAVTDRIYETGTDYETQHSMLGCLCTDGTYLYVSAKRTGDHNDEGGILRSLLSDWSYGGAIKVGDDLISNLTYDNDSAKIYASVYYYTVSPTNSMVSRVDASTFAVEQERVLPDWNTADTDDMVALGNYLYVILNRYYPPTGSALFRFLKTDLDSFTSIVLPSTPSAGAWYDGTYILVGLNTSPGRVLRVNPDTLDYGSYEFPNEQNTPAGFCQNGETVYFTFLMSPGKVSALDRSFYK
jgi:hypothetical protein